MGERVYLRPMVEDDASYVVKWRNDPSIRKWMFNQELLTVESHLKWFFNKDNSNRFDYIICDKATNNPIGTLNFTNIENDTAEAGKMIGNKDYWGKGYAKESFILWLKYGFEKIGLSKIYVRTMVNNIPNIKLNEKLGFKIKEETIILHDENRYNVLIMELNKQSFKD